ncbi:MAG: tetratricopeptide repeat protein [Pseudomonadota bacterium]|nr:tetratricopeptide repeat protein [Pseudomonadota bacterium]
MKQLSIFLLLLTFSLSALSISNDEFDRLISEIQDKKFDSVESYLEKNKGAKEPEYYVLLLNYSYSKGENTQIVVGSGEPKAGDFSLQSQATGKTEGYIGERTTYDKELIISGIKRAQIALKDFPERLDIHFGIITLAERIEEWEIAGDQLVTILRTSKEIDNKWSWGRINSMQGDPVDFMIQNILPRTYTFFRLNNEVGDKQLEKVSTALIKYYPNLIYGYANMGSLFMAKKEYDKAESYYTKALAIDGTDQIILSNLENLKKLRSQ